MASKYNSGSHPYDMTSFTRLMNKAYVDGWYSGRHNLLEVTMEGEFELAGAYETWGQLFTVKFKVPSHLIDMAKGLYTEEKNYTSTRSTLESACWDILKEMDKEID